LQGTDKQLLDEIQKVSFQFFWGETNPLTGQVKDRAFLNGKDTRKMASIAATGFGRTSLCIGDAAAMQRTARFWNLFASRCDFWQIRCPRCTVSTSTSWICTTGSAGKSANCRRIPPGPARAGGWNPAFQPRDNRSAAPLRVGPAFRTYEMLGRRVRCARKGPPGWPRGGLGCFGYCAGLVNRYTRGEMKGSLQASTSSRAGARSRHFPCCPGCCCMCQLTLSGTGTVPV
jgi:hypothetical protein